MTERRTGLFKCRNCGCIFEEKVDVAQAVKLGRRGKGVELNPDYFRDGVGYLESADAERDAPTLFDLLENGA